MDLQYRIADHSAIMSTTNEAKRFCAATEALLKASVNVVKVEESLEEMKALSLTASTMVSKMAELETNISSLNSRITSIDSNTSSTTKQMSNVKNLCQDMDTKIASMENQAKHHQTKILSIESSLLSSNRHMATLENHVNSSIRLLHNVSVDSPSMIERVDNLETKLSTLEQKTGQILDVMIQMNSNISNHIKLQRINDVIERLESQKFKMRTWFTGTSRKTPDLYFRNRTCGGSPLVRVIKCRGSCSLYLARIISNFITDRGWFVDGLSFESENSFCSEETVIKKEKEFQDDLVNFISRAVGDEPRLIKDGKRLRIRL